MAITWVAVAVVMGTVWVGGSAAAGGWAVVEGEGKAREGQDRAAAVGTETVAAAVAASGSVALGVWSCNASEHVVT